MKSTHSEEDSTETWWIPSFDIEISFYNLGNRSGTVENARIIGQLDGEELYFRSKYIVNTEEFRTAERRFDWIPSAIKRWWYPVILKGNDEKDLHIVIEANRWDEKRTGVMDFQFDIKYEGKEWETIDTYTIHLIEDLYDGTGMLSTRLNEDGLPEKPWWEQRSEDGGKDLASL